MKCEDWKILIEEYVDGALDDHAAGDVASHLAACSSCASLSEQLRSELNLYAAYQRDVEVTPMLWSSIEARIKQGRAATPPSLTSRIRETFAGLFAAPRLSPAFVAALVIIAVGITVAVMTLWSSRAPRELVSTNNGNTSVEPSPGPDKSATSQAPTRDNSDRTGAEKPANAVQGPKIVATAKKPAQPSSPATPAQLVREAEQKYLTAIAMLSRDVNRKRSQLDPMMLARLDASLSEIDRTIKETRRAVRENPSDPIALQYLLAAYSKKVDVLREMTTD